MSGSAFETVATHVTPLRNGADTLSALKIGPVEQIACKLSFATTFVLASVIATHAASDDSRKTFPTAHTISPSYISSGLANRAGGRFEVVDRNEVQEFIDGKPDVQFLYEKLPGIVESVFGKSAIHVSVFRDNEEHWSNLRIEIESNHEIEELSDLEEQLFRILEKNRSLLAALQYVTISCG